MRDLIDKHASTLVRKTVIEKELSDGAKQKVTEYEWEPGSKKSIAKAAAAGALMGSYVPGVGTVIGAAIGAAGAFVLGPAEKEK